MTSILLQTRPLPCPLLMVSHHNNNVGDYSCNTFSDGSKVEAQTPDGTRVATPSTAPLISSSRLPDANKTSYAAALKTKPSDWHLEFSMDDHLLPLDLTIYGAIHQHEIRKKLGPVPSSSMWQGIYTVKFKKVNGPPPSQEGRRYQPDWYR
jgi:E3 ubiquitin-protein ligase TRIP12